MNRLIVEKHQAVWLARFNNPPHGLMDQHTTTELAALLDAVESSDKVRAVVLTGAEPGVFIRHYDVAELAARGVAMAEKGLQFKLDRPVPEGPLHACLRRMESLEVPFIAAINGLALGGGLEVALACDIRLVESGNYELGLPEINIGLLPGAGGTQRLTRLLGEAKAMQFILTGSTMSPSRAVEVGLAAECVEGDVLDRALLLARGIASRSARATGHIKNLVRGASERSGEEGLAAERTLFCDLMVAPDSLAAMQEMLDRGSDIRDPEV